MNEQRGPEVKQIGEPKFSSKFIDRSKGVPHDNAVIAAIEKIADIWGNETKDVGDPHGEGVPYIGGSTESLRKLEDAKNELMALVPGFSLIGNYLMFSDKSFVALTRTKAEIK